KEEIKAFQPPANQQKKDALIRTLIQIHGLVGECIMESEAKQFYEQWYKEFEEKWGKPGLLSPFYARLQEYTKKLAILIAIDESLGLRITEAHIRTACNLAECYAQEITELIDEEFSGGNRNQIKVIKILKEAGHEGITREMLLKRTRLLADKELNPVIATLLESNQIEKLQEEVKSDKRDRVYPKITYIWLNGNGK